MNFAYFHLTVVHLPIVGIALGLFLFALSFHQKCVDLRKAALLLWLVSGVGIVPAYLSGEEAEEVIENTGSADETLIENHEESAETALVCVIALGVLSLIGGFIQYLGKPCPQTLLIIIGIAALLSLAAIARTAHLGGKIQHSEIR